MKWNSVSAIQPSDYNKEKEGHLKTKLDINGCNKKSKGVPPMKNESWRAIIEIRKHENELHSIILRLSMLASNELSITIKG